MSEPKPYSTEFLQAEMLNRIRSLESELSKAREEIESRDARLTQFSEELETERLRLAACGVAAQQNTNTSIKDRIGKDNPFYSASYSDVCRAVDREISFRAYNAELRDGLKRYGVHGVSCIKRLRPLVSDSELCECGLDALLAKE